MLCPDLKNASPLTATHTTPLGTFDHLVIPLLCLTAMLTGSSSQDKRATRITRALSLTLVTLDCPSALDFAWDQSTSVSFRRVLLVLQLSFLELTTQFAAFLLLCSYCSCFLLGKLGVGLSIICNGSESRPPFCIACNSAICAASFTNVITLPCCSGSRSHACSLETHCSCTASCISPTFRVCQ